MVCNRYLEAINAALAVVCCSGVSAYTAPAIIPCLKRWLSPGSRASQGESITVKTVLTDRPPQNGFRILAVEWFLSQKFAKRSSFLALLQ